jgi:cytochrome c-type biogenesis protein CcmF
MLTSDIVLLLFPLEIILADVYTLFQMQFEKAAGSLRRDLYFILTVIVIGAFYARIVYAFAISDFSFASVYLSSSSSLSLAYKIAASYADAAGSYLLSLSIVGLVVLSYRLRTGFGVDAKTFDLRKRTYLFADFVYAMLVVLIIPYDPFLRVSTVPPEGLGLNPLLKSFWMIVHPPIVYLGYAFVFVPAVFVLAALSLRSEVDFKHVRIFMELAWLFLTVGIVLGGMWAYNVIGWGGYWSWDPTEVASLIPWLAVTAYFHSFSLTGTKKALTREFLIFLSFALVLLAIFITRSGIVQSVHAFTPSVVGAGMIAVIAITIAAFFYFERRTGLPLIDVGIDWQSVPSISMAIAFVSLLALTLVCLVGEAVPVAAAIAGTQISIGPGYFVSLCYPLTLGFIVGLVGCDFPLEISTRKYLWLALFGLAAGSVLAVFKFPTPNALANVGIPIVLIAGVAVIASFVRGLVARSTMAGLRLVHLGAILIVLGILISSTMILYATNLRLDTGQPTQVQLGGSTITLQLGEPVPQHSGSVYFQSQFWNEMRGYAVDAQITSGSQSWSSVLSYSIYSAYGLFYTPAVVSTLLQDYFVTALPSSILTNGTLSQGPPQSSTVIIASVKVVPLAGLIWLGTSLMVVGMVVRIFWRSDDRRNGQRHDSQRSARAETKILHRPRNP